MLGALMPQKRNPENKGFPPRWRLLHGAIYYQVPKGVESLWGNKKLFRLGKTPSEAYKVWAERIENNIKQDTISDLLDRYLLEVIPTKAPKTRIDNKLYVQKLRPVFGDMPITGMEPQLVYKYVDKRTAKVAAKREIALLSHAYTKAVQWGYLNKHPFKGEIRLAGEKPRTRYIEDWEILECLALPSVRKAGSIRAIQAYIRLKLLTGLRRGDLLKLRLSDVREDRLHIAVSKTGKGIIYEITPGLHENIERAKQARPVDISPYLFCDKYGKCYINEETGDASGWNSMWQRFMDRLLAETKVTERFTEHDLRAKVASDAPSLGRAQQLMAHADSKITDRVYRRKAEVIKPVK